MKTEHHSMTVPHEPSLCGPGHPLFAERYRAIDSRDVRFDGQFFTTVSSTGIYCRPSCPAQTPKQEYVVFYPTSAAAQLAGFRACKRCLPEAASGTPEWNLRQDLAGRAMRLILDGLLDRASVNELASRLGYTPRHVHRVLTAELGAGPLALARARRAQTAHALVMGSALTLADVAFASGFNSVRQFNETFQAVFATKPHELRTKQQKRSRNASAECNALPSTSKAVRLSVELPVRQPFDAAGTFRFLASRAIAGVEHADLSDVDSLTFARTLRLPGGPGAIELCATRKKVSEWRLHARLELTSLSDVAPALTRVRRLLDLDADPVAVDRALQAVAELSPLISRTPGIRVPGCVDPHELVIRAIVGQQISVSAARTHLSRLAAHAGTPYESEFNGLTLLFPSSEQILSTVPRPPAEGPLDPNRLVRLPRRSVWALLEIAKSLQSGDLSVDIGMQSQDLHAALLAQPGVGPWTAAYLTMRILGDPDAWLVGDVALVAGAKRSNLIAANEPARSAHRTLQRIAESWSPWRSYAVMHLWQAAIN